MRAFRVLVAEAIRDGLRRRLALVVAVALVLGLASAQSCTQIGVGDLTMNGQRIDPAVIAGFLAPLLYASQAITVLAIAGLVAAEHLARPLGEGSAALWLARPVSREAWAGARLAGVVAIALLSGIVLLGGTGALLVARQGVTIGPALAGAAATALGAVVVAALTMAASLSLGRSAVMLLMMAGLTIVLVANSLGMAVDLAHPDVEFGGVLGTVDRFGPPLFTAIAGAVARWNPHVDTGDTYAQSMVRLALWGAGALALLVAAFRNHEIES